MIALFEQCARAAYPLRFYITSHFGKCAAVVPLRFSLCRPPLRALRVSKKDVMQSTQPSGGGWVAGHALRSFRSAALHSTPSPRAPGNPSASLFRHFFGQCASRLGASRLVALRAQSVRFAHVARCAQSVRFALGGASRLSRSALSQCASRMGRFALVLPPRPPFTLVGVHIAPRLVPVCPPPGGGAHHRRVRFGFGFGFARRFRRWRCSWAGCLLFRARAVRVVVLAVCVASGCWLCVGLHAWASAGTA